MDTEPDDPAGNHSEEVQQHALRNTAILVSAIISLTATIVECNNVRKNPQPYHTSVLSGEAWLIELLLGHPERIRCELGMHAHVFTRLVDTLRELKHDDSKFVSLEEQVAIFLYMSVTGLSIRHTSERFQRSNETISQYVVFSSTNPTLSRYFHKMVSIFSSAPFYTTHVHMPTPDEVQTEIRNNPRFWPYFKNAIGALDGSHIHAAPGLMDRAAFRNRKGFVSQNCLFACNFGLRVTYALTGWEGSANDARIYQDARSKDLHISAGKFFLADSGFPLRPELLVPYQNVRYHLAEWRRANLRYA